MADRAYRIEVDRCGDCPFLHDDLHFSWCEHPAAAKAAGVDGCPCVPDDYLDKGTPDWCPLRGAIVIVAGPRS